jgi:hypothetical protein
MTSIGAGNVAVTKVTTSQWIVRFIGALYGTDTSSASITPNGITPVSLKAYRYTPQMSQFLNYHFQDCRFEYNNGNFGLLNMGGYVRFTGYNSLINGINGGSGTWFTMDNLPSRANNSCHLLVDGARFEFRKPGCKLIDTWWNEHNKHIVFRNFAIGVDAIPSGQQASMEIAAFRSTNNSMCFSTFEHGGIPGYITVQNSGSTSVGGRLTIDRCNWWNYTSPSAGTGPYADQTALAAGNTAVRVLGGATIDWNAVVGSGGTRVTNGTTQF